MDFRRVLSSSSFFSEIRTAAVVRSVCLETRPMSGSIIFEAERGKGKTGEIAVDGVLLVSGSCPDGLVSVDG